MTLSKFAQQIVTDHAIVRWLERVERFDIDEIRQLIRDDGQTLTDSAILRRLHQLYGLTRGHFTYKIANKKVRLAIAAGAKRINQGTWTFCVENGVITTIRPRTGEFDRRERARRLGKTRRRMI